MAGENENGIPKDVQDWVAPGNDAVEQAAVPSPDQDQVGAAPDSKDKAWQEAHDRLPQVLLQHLRSGDADQVQSTMEFVQQSWPTPPSDAELRQILESPEAQEAAREGMLASFRFGSVDMAQQILEVSHLPDGQFDSPAMKEAATEGMLRALKNGSIEGAANLHEAAGLPEELWQSPDVQQAISARLAKRGKDGGLGIATDELQSMLDEKLIAKETLRTPDMQRAFEVSFLRALREGHTGHAVQDFMELPEGYMERPDVRQAATQGFERMAGAGSSQFEQAKKIATTYGLSEAEMAAPLKKAALQYVEWGYYNDIGKLVDSFPAAAKEVQSPDVQAALKKRVVEHMANPYEKIWTPDILQAIPLLAEILRSPEGEAALKKRYGRGT
ncbi:MAG: hypothetical protein V1916_01915 [Patescibacteria group bacterium]